MELTLFFRQPTIDARATHERVQKGYGVTHPERINGYAGAFCFSVPDVYISQRIAARLKLNPKFREVLMEYIKRFCREDYGFVTNSERDSNGETRWLSGSSVFMIGRYAGEYGAVVLETFKDMSLMYFIEEESDTEAIWQKQNQKLMDAVAALGFSPQPGTRLSELHFRLT